MNVTVLVLACIVFVGAWELSPTSLATQRSDFTATLLNGKIYLAGGCQSPFQYYDNTSQPTDCTNVTSSFYEYDVSTATPGLSQKQALPVARYRHAAAAVGDSLFLVGGYDDTGSLISQVDVYNTVSGVWSQTTPLPAHLLRSDVTSFVIGNVIYIAGGYSANFVTLDSVLTMTTTDSPRTWSNSTAPLIAHRGDACAVTINGEGYVFGGFSDRNWCEPLTSLEKYNPTTDEWVKEAQDDLSTRRGDKACVALGGKMIVMGGEQKDDPTSCSSLSYAVDDVEVYDPTTNRWSAFTALNTATFRFPAASNGVDRLYAFGGQTNLTRDSDLYAHRLTNNVFTIAFTPTTPAPTSPPTSTATRVFLACATLFFALFFAII